MPSIISSSSTTLETSSSNCSIVHSVHPCDSVLESNSSDDTVSQYSSKRIRTLLGNPFRFV
jgi:fumarate hydratase class II